MERTQKRIVAIVAVAVIVTGGIIGAFVIIALLPGTEAYYVTPGVDNVDPDFMIKIGILGDKDQIVGDGAWEGAWLAAYEINSNDGILINNTVEDPTAPNGRYYIGITMEDTDEMNPVLTTSRAVQAAERIINTKEAQFTLGGFRTEAVLAYTEVLMQAETMFLSCGAAEDQFTLAVKNDPAKYKYWFRVTPTNSSTLGTQIILGVLGYRGQLDTIAKTYSTQNITHFGLLYEDLLWTGKLVQAIKDTLSTYSLPLVFDEAFDVGLTSTQMAGYVQQMKSQKCDIVIPVISGSDSILLMNEYVKQDAPFMLIGVDVQSQDSRFWDNTDGDCRYEIISQSLTDTNKTVKSKKFWADYSDKWQHDPIYTASGAYDAMYMYAMAINETQSLNATKMITNLETHNAGTNPIIGVGGQATWTQFHDLWIPDLPTPQYPHGVTLFAQWQADAAKECIPCNTPYGPLYPGPESALNITTASMEIPPWVITAWTDSPSH